MKQLHIIDFGGNLLSSLCLTVLSLTSCTSFDWNGPEPLANRSSIHTVFSEGGKAEIMVLGGRSKYRTIQVGLYGNFDVNYDDSIEYKYAECRTVHSIRCDKKIETLPTKESPDRREIILETALMPNCNDSISDGGSASGRYLYILPSAFISSGGVPILGDTIKVDKRMVR